MLSRPRSTAVAGDASPFCTRKPPRPGRGSNGSAPDPALYASAGSGARRGRAGPQCALSAPALRDRRGRRARCDYSGGGSRVGLVLGYVHARSAVGKGLCQGWRELRSLAAIRATGARAATEPRHFDGATTPLNRGRGGFFGFAGSRAEKGISSNRRARLFCYSPQVARGQRGTGEQARADKGAGVQS